MMRMAILAAGLAALVVAPAQAADNSLSPQANAAFLAANAKTAGVIVEPSGLQHPANHNGYGKRPNGADLATVQYRGTPINGKGFGAPAPGPPAQFQVKKPIPRRHEAVHPDRDGGQWG